MNVRALRIASVWGCSPPMARVSSISIPEVLTDGPKSHFQKRLPFLGATVGRESTAGTIAGAHSTCRQLLVAEENYQMIQSAW
jgi:hypothetical protein